jgi:ParB family chromosome partitioning protein
VRASALSVPIAEIGELEPDQYVGLIDVSAVACLTVRLAAEGLHTPIWLRRNGNAAKTRWTVIAGRHRLRAARQLGWAAIHAEQRADASSGPDELRRLQLAENLDRRVLRPIERALHIMARWRGEVEERGWDIVSHARDADAATAVACGVDERTIRRYRRIHDEIISRLPDLFAALNAHPLGESLSAMTQLARLNDVACLKAATLLLSRPDWKSMDEVLSAAGIKISTGNRVDAERSDAVLLDAWSKAGTVVRRAHVEWLAAKLTPGLAQCMIAGLKARGLL